ncbi:MAG: pyridoxal phosphate-dependent aminotransferase, partial [Pseudomonadota bacterium]
DADDGWGAYYKAVEMLRAGENVTMLCIGEHDFKTAPFILDAMETSARGGNTGYALARGQLPLREAVARRVEAQTGVATTEANVTITTGGQAALFAAVSAAADPGEPVVIVDPHYATYPATVCGPGCALRKVKARPETGFQLDLDDLRAATKGAKALLINTPNNPTGAVYDAKTLEAIRAACIENDLWLISDEVYDGQVHEGEHVSPRTLPGMEERTMVIGSLSKSHVMTGFRLGWIVAPGEVIEGIHGLSNATTYGVPGFIQDAATVALTEGDAFEAETAAKYRARRDKAVAALRGANKVSLSPPQGAMYVMLDIRATGMSGNDFALGLLDEEKIAVMPGESFGEAAAGHLRVALTTDDDAMVDALERLAAYAERVAA